MRTEKNTAENPQAKPIEYYDIKSPQELKDMAQKALQEATGKWFTIDEINTAKYGWDSPLAPVQVAGEGWAEDTGYYIDIYYHVNVEGVEDDTAYIVGQSFEMFGGKIESHYTNLKPL